MTAFNVTSSHVFSPVEMGGGRDGGGRAGRDAAKWKNGSLLATRQKAETDLNMTRDSVGGRDPCDHPRAAAVLQPFKINVD